MGAFRKEDSLYSKDEAFICLNCKLKKCNGKCERLKKEKQKLRKRKAKRMIKRFIYWITHKHPCKACCLFCKFYNKCKEDTEIDNNVCVACGEIIPEGLQVCPNCEEESELKNE